MKKYIYTYTAAALLVVGVTCAVADPGGEGNNTNCNGVGNANSPCDGGSNGGQGGTGGNGGNGGQGGQSNQGQGQGQAQGQGQVQGQAQGQAQGQSIVNNIDLSGLPDTRTAPSQTNVGGSTTSSSGASSHSNANVGDTTANVGDTSSVAGAVSGGNKTSQGVVVEGDTYSDESVYSYRYENDYTAASAASVYADVCQSGGSAQGKAGGFAVVNSEILCDHLRMAAFYQNAYLWELQHGSVVCAEPMSFSWPQGQFEDHCVSDKAIEYYQLWHESIDDATLLMDKTEEAGLVDKFAGYLARPMAIIGALVWLL